MSTPVSGPPEIALGGLSQQDAEAEARPSLVATAFEGWQLMAAAVADTNPELARAMTTGGLLVRAAFEEQIPRLLDDLTERLGYGGLAPAVRREVIDELAGRLWEPRFPFSSEWMLTQHREAVNAVFTRERALLSNRRLWQAANAAIRLAFEPAAAEAAESAPVVPPEKLSPGEWRIIATVERPEKIGQPGSLLCRTPQGGWRKHIRLEETTYQGITRTSTPSGPVEPEQWVALADERVRDFDYREPAEFAIGLHNPPELALALKQNETVSSAAYFLQLDASKEREEMVGRFIEQNKQAIRTATHTAISAAAGFIPGGLLVPPGVLTMIPDLIVNAIAAILNRRIAATVLPSWIVQHTVIKVGGQLPTSAVLLHSAEQPNVTLVGAQDVNGTMQVADDYGDFPVPQLWPRGRILTGPTEPTAPEADLPAVVPAELWRWVDEQRRPLVWSDAWESPRPPTHGFRVLVPFSPSPPTSAKQQPKGPHYVAALRVEVFCKAGGHWKV